MTALQLQAHILAIRLTLARLGWTTMLACALCISGAAAWAWAMPYMRAQIEVRQQAITRARQSLRAANEPAPAPVRSLAEKRLANFYENLGEKRYAEQQLKTLFAIAGKTQLTLNQAEYKPAFDKNGRYHTYQVILPVKGTYGAVREFCEQTLLAIPFASLDEMNFKRDTISSRTLEAKLHFTLYLADEAAAAAHGSIIAAHRNGDS